MITSTLRHSRDFLRQALAANRAGQEGPDIKVEPFDSHNVSTDAGLVKLATSIAAARRRNANMAAQQRDADLQREYVRAQIAHMRAQAGYEDARAAAPAPVHRGNVTGQDFTIGGKVYPAGTPAHDVDVARGLVNDADRRANRGGNARARAGLKELHDRIEQEAGLAAQQEAAGLSPYISAINDYAGSTKKIVPTHRGPQPLYAHALDVLKGQSGGVDFTPYAAGAPPTTGYAPDEQTYVRTRIGLQKTASKALQDALLAKHRRALYEKYSTELQSARDGVSAAPSDAGGADEGPPALYDEDQQDDPAGLFAQ